VADARATSLDRLHLRARLPKYFRIGAVAVLALTLIAVGIGYYRAKSTGEFRMKNFPTELSKDVIASVNGYERREIDGETVKYYIKADRATTFSDNHQELENVYFQVFDSAGAADEITAAKAVYIPETNKNFTGYFAGDVNIKTRDSLLLKTEQITYAKASETVTAEEAVEFERQNVRGRSFGAVLKMPEKRIDLNRDVFFEFSEADGSVAELSSASGFYDHQDEVIELRGGVHLASRSGDDESTDVRAREAKISLSQDTTPRSIRRIEAWEQVAIEQNKPSKKQLMTAGTAVFDKPADRFELEREVKIDSIGGEKQINFTAAKAVYEKTGGKASLLGNGQIVRGNDLIRADQITADLYADDAIKRAEANGNAYLKQTGSENDTEIASPKFSAMFGEDRNLARADTEGQSRITRTPRSPGSDSHLTIVAANAIRSFFHGPGMVEKIDTDGRTTIKMDTPDNGVDSANKQISADSVKTIFWPDGKNMQRAEAAGNAELMVMPHRASVDNYSVRANAPRFDCDFFSSNNPKICVAATSTKTVRTPTVAREGRGEQVINADRLNVSFDEKSRNVGQYEGAGKTRFVELDRNAIASSFVFTTSDEIVRLRGGEPTAWDSAARVKAKEIDWDTKNRKSFYRTGVSTTYYSAKGTGNAAPFGENDKPVYMTSQTSEIDHAGETAVYEGNARGWQGSSYVRANRIVLRQRQSQMNADGSVQSLLYQMKQGSADASAEPVYAASSTMSYDGNSKVIRYEQNVDVRQGTDRIKGAIAVVHLNEYNEIIRTDFETNVVINQPKRQAFADFAQYTAADERILLRGRPARIEDVEKGNFQGAELLLFTKDNRVVGEGKSAANPSGRVRSTYKVQ